MTASRREIPVLLMVDAEPTGFFIPRHRPDPWLGFERGLEIMAEIRRRAASQTGRPVHFTWLVRADPQIEEVYGSAAWALDRYRRCLDDLADAGDEIGLHVHAYRWSEERRNWIEDYGDQQWVEDCVQAGFRAFEGARGGRPRAFSMGTDWTNQATMRLARSLAVRWELTPILGTEPRPLRYLTGPYTGEAPDCTRIPRLPYQPSDDDFTTPAAPRPDGMWIFPLSSRIAPLPLSWKRNLYERLLLRPVVRQARKFFLTDDPVAMRPAIDDALRRDPRPYLTFSARTDEFLVRRSVAAIRANVDHLLERAADELVFTTPDEALRALHLGTAPQEGG